MQDETGNTKWVAPEGEDIAGLALAFDNQSLNGAPPHPPPAYNNSYDDDEEKKHDPCSELEAPPPLERLDTDGDFVMDSTTVVKKEGTEYTVEQLRALIDCEDKCKFVGCSHCNFSFCCSLTEIQGVASSLSSGTCRADPSGKGDHAWAELSQERAYNERMHHHDCPHKPRVDTSSSSKDHASRYAPPHILSLFFLFIPFSFFSLLLLFA